ncbi:MAG TPA: PLP-dependent aminotransferase family protein [Aminobacteriaceae bacterium]|nr:PLP-dependent aminotransferase family protein [Aminobacteriaceae bacterium]
MNPQFARRMTRFQESDLTPILRLAANPEVISFAGGLPAPELFPVEDLKKVAVKVLDANGRRALQYSATEGHPPLREKIAARTNRNLKTSLTAGNVVITTGSQQSLDILAKMYIDEGDCILCESPTYLGALSAFNSCLPAYREVATDGEGMIIADLEKALASEKRAKMIYVIPDFQNPSGKTWSLERRKAFLDTVSKYDILVVEDNPYGELRFEGTTPPSLKSMDTRGQVVMLGTFSKIFCPGVRVAWVCGEPAFLESFCNLKQAADLHTSTISQYEIDAYLSDYDIEEHIKKLVSVYRERRDLMIRTMDASFPKEVVFTRPEGGLFTWAEMPEHVNARDLFLKALEKKVAFVPGGAFFPNGGHENTMRLNYSNMPPERIVEGIERLGAAIREYL